MCRSLKLTAISALVTSWLIFWNVAQAQDVIRVKGIVTDINTKEVLPRATVQEVGGKIYTVTDDKGVFGLSVPAGARLRITMTGYESITVAAGGNIKVQLKPSATNLEDVVLTGYTSQKRELLTGSVVTVKLTEADREIPTTSPANLLAGKMAGVSVSTPDGQPQSQPGITIRTPSSWNSAPVLVVIDGKIAAVSDFNNMSPNEIETVTVLKDGATTAAYGSRAAGGVLLVTTRRGSAGKATIQFSMNTGYDKRGKNEALTSAVEWGSIYARIWGYGNPGPAGCPWEPSDSVYFATHNFGGAGDGYGFNQLKAVYRNPLTTTYNLSASGGSGKIKYFIGGSYVNQQSFLRGTQYKKYNVRANITADLNKDFSVFAGISLDDKYTYGPSSQNLSAEYSKLLVWQPYMPSFTNSGKPVWFFWPSNMSAESNGDGGYSNDENINPVINLSVNYRAPFMRALSAKATFIKSYSNYEDQIYSTPFTLYQVKQVDPVIWDLADSDIVTTYQSWQTPYLEQQASWSQDQQLDFQLSFDSTFGKHHVSGTLVYESYQDEGAGVDGGNVGFPLYTTPEWWATTQSAYYQGSPANFLNTGYGNSFVNGRRSWVGQFFYDYAQKYLATFTYRYDGSMNFAPDKRWGFFPSASAGWIISKENFFQNVHGIDMLKLRGSVGLTGNDNVGGWQWQQSYQGGNSAFFGAAPAQGQGIHYGGEPNPDITWEKYLDKNIGVDMTFLKNFNATLEYWHKYTYDILGSRIQTTPPSFSLSLPAVNYGKEKAQGIDMSVGYNKRIGQVNFMAGVNGSYGYSWYTQMDQNITYDYQNQVGEGRTTSMVTGYKVDHMIRTQEDLAAWNSAHPGYNFNGYKADVGQFVYRNLVDPNGMGAADTINNYDIAVLKKRNVPVILGLNLGAEWRGFSLAATFNGWLGYSKSFGDLNGGVEWNRMWKDWYGNAWTPSNPNAWLPRRYSANDGTNSTTNSGSNFWYANNNFLRLKNLNLAYTLPPKLYRRYASDIRFYVSGSNLFVISKFNKKFYDPEMGSGTSFPIVKSFNAGCTITF